MIFFDQQLEMLMMSETVVVVVILTVHDFKLSVVFVTSRIYICSRHARKLSGSSVQN